MQDQIENLIMAEMERYRKQQKRERKQMIFRRVLLLLLLVIITILSIIIILNRSKPEPNFLFLTVQPLSEEAQADCLIVRDETVYSAPANGYFHSFIPQGSKVAKGEKLGQVVSAESLDALRQIDKANQDVDERRMSLLAKGEGGSAQQIFQSSDEEIRRNIRLFYDLVLSRQENKVAEVDSNLRLLMAQRVLDVENIEFEDGELERLQAYRDGLEEASRGQFVEVLSEHAGSFIRTVDGLEEELIPDKLATITEKELKDYLARSGGGSQAEILEAGDPMYKLSRSIDYYFVTVIPRGFRSLIERGSQLSASCAANAVELNSLVVERIEEVKEGTLLVLRADTMLEAFAGMRRADLRLNLSRSKGLRVPKTALIGYEEGNLEADIKVVNGGFIRLCPVKILESNAYYALIEATEDSPYKVEVSSMVLLNPESMKEDDPIAKAY